jgi:hypothetical protein
MRSLVLISLLLLPSGGYAQAATVAVVPAGVSNPLTPIRPPVTYSTPVCDEPVFTETTPIVNPFEGYYTDPARPTRNCKVDVRAQMAALPVGAGYRAAVKIGSEPYGPLSTAFAIAAGQTTHPCDSTPASPTQVNAGQSFTLGWCHTGTNVTGWRVYRNGTPIPVTVTPGTTVNAAGKRYYTVSRTEATPLTGLQHSVSALNGTSEGTSVPFATIAVVPLPPPVPTEAPTNLRIVIQ